MPSEFLIVAKQVLEREQRALTPEQIVNIAIGEGLFPDNFAGKTPHQTMKSKLSVDVRKKGAKSQFVRTKPGHFYLRNLLTDEKPYQSPPFAKSIEGESVLLFPSTWLDGNRTFQGINIHWKRMYQDLLRPEVCTYMHRTDAEMANDYKQVLTYIIVTRRNQILAFRRGNYNRVEDFLKGSECIGFGGHVSANDKDLFSAPDMGVRSSAIRELNEELQLPEPDRRRLERGTGLKCIGLLNDDSSPVGRRHFAFLFRYEVSGDKSWDNPERGEKSITQLRWLGPPSPELLVPIRRFEYWSQLCFREYYPKWVHSASTFNIVRKRPLTPPHLLCVIGSLGSGKSEFTRLLCSEFGYEEINTGQVVAQLLGIPPVPETPRDIFQKRAEKFISKSGASDVLARAICERVETLSTDKILIDGLRQLATFEAVKTYGHSRVGLVYIHTLPDIAYKLYSTREGGGQLSIEQFLKLRDAAVEREVGEFLRNADAVLYNWIGLAQYRKAAQMMMRELINSHE